MATTSRRADNFPVCLALTLVYEGEWSNHPLDPGKATMRGVTQSVYDEYRAMQGQTGQSVRYIRDDELVDIYRWRYWDAVRAGSLPLGADYAVFDFAVNSGVRRAAFALQKVLGIVQDGAVGPLTISAAAGFAREKGNAVLSDAICAERGRFLRGLKTYGTFGRGWEMRVFGSTPGSQVNDTGVADRALRMIAGTVATIPAAPLVTPKTFAAAA